MNDQCGWASGCAVFQSSWLPNRWQWSASGMSGVSMGGAATEEEAWEKARAAQQSLKQSITPKGVG